MKSRFYKILVATAVLGGGFLIIPAQEPGAPSKQTVLAKATETVGEKPKSDEALMREQIQRLETQMQMMRAELEALKRSVGSAEKTPEKDSGGGTQKPDSGQEIKAPDTAAAAVAAAPSEKSAETAEKEDLSVDVGDYRITPYGIIFFNAFSNSGGTNNADDPLWATTGRGNTGASGRQTRFGVKIEGGRIGGAAVTGVIEADFYGGFPGVGVGENMGVVRLRVAKAKFDWERTSLTVGQDWVIFAPNNPTSLAAAAIPQFAAAGNPWSRLPQVRIEQKIGENFRWQGAVLAPGTGDFPAGGATPALLQPGSGAASRLPFFQSRVAYTEENWFGTKKSGTIGFAGHYGRSRITAGAVSDDIDSYGFALDWNFPLIPRVTAAGEAFFGRNLGGFQAGIFQGYNTDFGLPPGNEGAAGSVRGIRTRGGWLQLGWNLPTWKDRLTVYGSIGIDDPENEDLISISNRSFRSRNLGYAFDLIYSFSPQFAVGMEFRRLETSSTRSRKESSNHVNLGAKYSF